MAAAISERAISKSLDRQKVWATLAAIASATLKKLVKQLVVEMKKTYNALRRNDSSRGGLHEAWETKKDGREELHRSPNVRWRTPSSHARRGIEAQGNCCGYQENPEMHLGKFETPWSRKLGPFDTRCIMKLKAPT